MNMAWCQEQIVKMEPSHRLWNNADFQNWMKVTKGQLEHIEKALMLNSWKDKVLKDAIAQMGLTEPVTQEDQLRLYIALKAVLGFERRKLSLLETQSDNYEEVKRKIIELRGNGDIGNNRTVTT